MISFASNRRRLPLLALLAALLVLASPAPPAAALGGAGELPGICGYEAALRAAIEAALAIGVNQCDEVTEGDLGEITELVLSDRQIDRFAPEPDQLVGFDPFLRIDLRDTQLTLADIDPGAIPLTDGRDDLFYTLILSGGGSANGFAANRYLATEGEQLLVGINWGDRPDTGILRAAKRIDGDPGGQIYFAHRVYSEQEEADNRNDLEFFRWIVTRDDDPADALYATVLPIHDDREIERDRQSVEEIEIDLLVVTDDRGELGSTEPSRADALYRDRDAPLRDYVDDYLEGSSDRESAELIIADNDIPATPVCSRTIVEQIEELLDLSRCQDISARDLGHELDEFDLSDSGLESLAAGDLGGLTGLARLDLSGNELATLPRGIFSDIGTGRIEGYPEEGDQEVLIDLRDNRGATGQGLYHTDLPSHVLADLKEHQRIQLNSGAGLIRGFDRASYQVAEGGTLAFIVRLEGLDRPAIEFQVLATDTAEADPTEDSESFDLPGLVPGQNEPSAYRLYSIDHDNERRLTGTFAVAVDIPEESIDDGRNDTFTMRLATRDGIGSTQAIAKVTILDGDDPVDPDPGPPPPDLGTWLVEDANFYFDDKNATLAHNVPELSAIVDGQALVADFLGHYLRTGAKTRWGLPTSEVLVIESGALTQYYQRGVVDFHRRSDLGGAWVIERRLAWDYFGGGDDGSIDLGVELGTFNPNPGQQLGPWGHKVSNQAVDGTQIGFADFFDALGGVDSFGYPKTEARVDSNLPGTLFIPAATPDFIRQYFQAAVIEFHPGDPGDPIKLRLLGDDLRNQQFPNASFAGLTPFQAATRLPNGSFYIPEAVSATAVAASNPNVG